MKSLELFTGAGGLALGTHLAGFEHVALLEWDHDACETLRRNARARSVRGINKWNIHEGDIRLFDFESVGGVELVAGGVPCQPFSIGGKHGGMNDGRDMFPEFVRAIRTLQPRAFIVENVKGLLRESFADYFSYILKQLRGPEISRKKGESWQEHSRRLDTVPKDQLKGLRYNVSHRLLNAADFGVPQTRQRVFIVGFRSDVGPGWEFPRPTHSESVLRWQQFGSGSYWKKHSVSPPRETLSQLSMDLAEPPLGIKGWRTVRDAIADLPVPTEKDEDGSIANHWLNPGARSYVGHTGSYIDWPAKTLKAGVHGVPGGENMIAFRDGSVRYFSVREAARMQTFPDRWLFEGAWSEAMRQLGNAVPVELAATVAKSVAQHLSVRDKQKASSRVIHASQTLSA
ncbi:MAG: DNA cytosine methyltransferase [Vicinamibacteria bacterium]